MLAGAGALGNNTAMSALVFLSSRINAALLQVANIYLAVPRTQEKTCHFSIVYSCIVAALMLEHFSINVITSLLRLKSCFKIIECLLALMGASINVPAVMFKRYSYNA